MATLTLAPRYSISIAGVGNEERSYCAGNQLGSITPQRYCTLHKDLRDARPGRDILERQLVDHLKLRDLGRFGRIAEIRNAHATRAHEDNAIQNVLKVVAKCMRRGTATPDVKQAFLQFNDGMCHAAAP